MATDEGLPDQAIVDGLNRFSGVDRRFQVFDGTHIGATEITLVDDYGHHPTEIEATLQTARSLEPERIVVLFQPHRYSRTQRLAEDFGEALQGADLVYVTDVYPAGEAPIEGVSGETIVEAVERQGDTQCYSQPSLARAHPAVGNILQPGDLVLTLGAGNVHEAGRRVSADLTLLEALRNEFTDDEIDAKLYEPMRRHTTMLVGGPAQYWVEPRTFSAFARAIAFFKDRGIPVRVVGRGSNLLVGDGGIRGAVIHTAKGEVRSEEHTSELQSRRNLVCRLLLEKKNDTTITRAC